MKVFLRKLRGLRANFIFLRPPKWPGSSAVDPPARRRACVFCMNRRSDRQVFGVRQSTGAIALAADRKKRQRAAALQDAVAMAQAPHGSFPPHRHGVPVPVKQPEIVESGVACVAIHKADIDAAGHRLNNTAYGIARRAGQGRPVPMAHHETPCHAIIWWRVIPCKLMHIVRIPISGKIRTVLIGPKIGPIGVHKFRRLPGVSYHCSGAKEICPRIR